MKLCAISCNLWLYCGNNADIEGGTITFSMHILSSMTDAPPETRFVLITWAARFRTNFLSGSPDVLADFGLSKHHFRKALEYLVHQEYFLKINNNLVQPSKRKSKAHFIYGLTIESRQLWIQALKACAWPEELNYVLSNPKLFDARSAEKSAVMNVQTRLVLAALLMQTNQAGYVIGCDSLILARMLGMTERKLRLAITDLTRKGIVSIAAKGVARSAMFNRLTPIYKIHPQRSDRKIVNIGVDISPHHLNWFRLSFRLQEFYHKARKHPSLLKVFARPFELTTDQYHELSKMFCSGNLIAAIHHLCVSTIFSLVPFYTSTMQRNGNQDAASEFRTEIRNDWRALVHKTLASALTYDQPSNPEDVDPNSDTTNLSQLETMALLRAYTLHELTNELVVIIQNLSKNLSIFGKYYGGHALVFDYLPNEHMVSIPMKMNNSGANERQHAVNNKINEQSISVSCVLKALVPNDVKFDDCMVIGDEVWTANSRVGGQKIRRVERLICSKKGFVRNKKIQISNIGKAWKA